MKTISFSLSLLWLTMAYVNARDLGNSRFEKRDSETNEVGLLPVAEVIVEVTEEPTVTSCIDHAPLCATWKRFCKDGTFGHMTREHCPKTCGLCTVSDGESCVDISSRCATWGKYCHDGTFGHMAKEHCPRTCKVCTRETVAERALKLLEDEIEDLWENV